MNKQHQVVILGGGLAGANAAFALRERGFDGRIVLVGEEEAPPYERPPLSKAYLRGEEPFEKALVRPPADYTSERIELAQGRRAVSLDWAARLVRLDDGSTLPYDSLLLATGAKARRLDVPGAELAGVHYLRSVRDADAIRQAAADAAQVAVVGGGWIGSEVAASLRQLGRRVTLISPRQRPLEHVLGGQVAEIYRRVHADNGVNIVSGRLAAIHGHRRAEELALDDGRRLAADMLVVGVGAVPRTELAAQAGLTLDGGGIAVDELLRTSQPGIYAAGDVASAWHPRLGRRLRVEHWDNAIQQGRTAAANMLGANEPYERTPYLYSDQFDLGMEYRGHAPQWDEVVLRGELERREFHAFWLNAGRVLAAMNVNLWDDGDELLRLVESGAPVDAARLSDPTVPLARAA